VVIAFGYTGTCGSILPFIGAQEQLTCSPNVNQLALSSLNTHLNRIQEVLLVILARFVPFV
jgi:hypothetical protein